MKLFITILFSALMALSFGKDSVVVPDTTYIGNTVKVEIQSATKHTDDSVEEKRHDEDLAEARKANAETRSMVRATWLMNWGTWVLAFFAALAFALSWRTFRITKWQSRQELRAYIHFTESDIWHSKVPYQGKRKHILIFLLKGDFSPVGGKLGSPPVAGIVGTQYLIEWQNLGQTPAYNIVCGMRVQAVPFPIPTDHDFPPSNLKVEAFWGQDSLEQESLSSEK